MVGHTGSVADLAFTADGNHIVSRGIDDGWMLWPGPTGWRDELCAKLTANMTRAEWAQWVSPTIEYRAPCPGAATCPSDPTRRRAWVGRAVTGRSARRNVIRSSVKWGSARGAFQGSSAILGWSGNYAEKSVT